MITGTFRRRNPSGGVREAQAPGDPLVEVARSRNVYSQEGRLQLTVDKIDAGGRSRGVGFGWTDGDALTSMRTGELAYTDPTFADQARLRATETRRDGAGRVVSEIIGEAIGPNDLIEATNVFGESRVTDYRGDDAQVRQMREPREDSLQENRLHPRRGRMRLRPYAIAANRRGVRARPRVERVRG